MKTSRRWLGFWEKEIKYLRGGDEVGGRGKHIASEANNEEDIFLLHEKNSFNKL
jgi:hypothetical protein